MADLYLMGNAGSSQMFGAVIRTANKTVVIDGGCKEDEKQLETLLSELCGLQVDAWFFTHPHHDHVCAFCELFQHNPNLQIGGIYHAFPQYAAFFAQENGMEDEFELSVWKEAETLLRERAKPCVHLLKKGDLLSFDDVTVKVLRVFHPEITHNFLNNSSTVYRIETPETSILILGDLGTEGGEELLADCPLADLQADYTQMAHHGQHGVSKAFYDSIRPKRCIWAAPAWLWDNNAGNGFDTGPWETVRTREWMEELGVKEHFVQKDGMRKIKI